MNDIFVLDNPLPPELVDEIEDAVTHPSVPWYFCWTHNEDTIKNKDSIPGIIVPDTNKCLPSPRMVHLIHSDRYPECSTMLPLMVDASNSILNHLEMEVDYFKIQLTYMNNHTKVKEDCFNIPHVDRLGQSTEWNLVYYINESDGDTFFFNERYDGTVQKEVTLRHRLSPKKGSAVVFKDEIFHASQNPIKSDFRFTMNANFRLINHNK